MFWRKKDSTKNSRRALDCATQAPPLTVERLEPRTMLNATASLASGLLTVTASGTRDRLYLSLDKPSSQLIVRDNGQTIGSFASASVSQIAIAVGDGNDTVQIDTNVLQPTTITAGNGNVVLEAGGGPTTIKAGNGNDKLIGGSAPSVLVTGNGNSTLVGKSGQDTLQVGSGRNKLFVTGHDMLVGVTAQDTVYGQLATDPPPANPDLSPDPPGVTLTTDEVQAILQRAAAADPNDSAIVAIMDRSGRLLGVSVEKGVSTAITGNNATLSFAIDGAIAKARTGAFFGNDQAPLTSRTIQFISQSTITQREVESNPNITDPNSTVAGPGVVAPIGIGGNFPPGIAFTPQVDLFQIELSNRDSSSTLLPGNGRFNIPAQFLTGGINTLTVPDAYGTIVGSALLPGGSTQNRGIATLPGGIPIYKINPANGQLIVVGGIGVFFPGTTGYATAENSSLSAGFDPSKPDLSLEAEVDALVAIGGSSTLSTPDQPAGTFRFLNLPGAPSLPELDIPGQGQINLAGITLPLFGPNGPLGPDVLLAEAAKIKVGTGNVNNVGLMPVDPAGDKLLAGQAVPEGWLVTPHDGVGITAAQVTQIINQGIAQANDTRAQIRLPLNSSAKMVFAVTDTTGEVLGLYRMPDATMFSLDIAVAKARNVAYYDDPTQLQPQDQLPGIQAGTAFTNRTFRFLAEPFYPEGIQGQPPAVFSILNDGGVDPRTGLNVGPPLPASAFHSIAGFDAFHPHTNFHDPNNLQDQNGVVFFPGSSPLYLPGGRLIGGLGVSGDGVDEDDVITFGAAQGFRPPPNVTRADQVFFAGVRLPYQEFNRNPLLP